jgi:hypothetical protein
MLLPPHERTDGAVARPPFVLDNRIPSPIRDDLDIHDPKVAAHSPYTDDRCADGRHLFDIIESASWREVEVPGDEHGPDYVEQATFRARLTCVRCGKVVEWEGTRTERHVGRLIVDPLTAGDFVAQHTSGHIDLGNGWGPDRDRTRWTIYQHGRQVGVIDWGCTTRGRYYHRGRLDEWPGAESVEATSPIGVLRKIAKRAAA